MQGNSQDAKSGMAIQRVFARSRYEASYLQEAYDLLLRLSEPQATQTHLSSPRDGIASAEIVGLAMTCAVCHGGRARLRT